MKIIIGSFSYGDNVLLEYIEKEKTSGKKILIYNVMNLPDPYFETNGMISSDGESESVINFMLEEPQATKVKEFLEEHQSHLKGIVEQFKKAKVELLTIFYGCAGGIQRSVFIANTMCGRLSRIFPEDEIIKSSISSRMKTRVFLQQ